MVSNQVRNVCVACAALFTCMGGYGAPWTHHGGDAARTGHAPAAPLLLDVPAWVATAPADVEHVATSSPVVFGGRVFANARVYGTEGLIANRIIAYASRSGAEVWARDIDPDVWDSWSSPAVYPREALVVIGSGSRVHALDCASGAVRWQTPLARTVVNASPAISEDLAVDGVPANRAFLTDYAGFGESAALYALNVDPYDASANPFAPGAIAWSAELDGASGNSPAYHDGVVYVTTTGGTIRAFAALDGLPLWSTNVAEQGYPDYASFFGGLCVSGTALYAASYNFYGSGDNSGLFKLDAATGDILWVAACERTESIPVVAETGRIFLAAGLEFTGSATKVQAFEDLGTHAALLWDTDAAGLELIGGWSHQPALAAQRLLVGAPDPSATFGPYTDLYAFDLAYAPGEAGFIAQHYTGAGGNPALAGGWLYTFGPAGLVAFAQRTPGDTNCDGAVNAFDLDPFVLALSDPAGFELALPDCDILNADTNADGAVDAFDIDPFIVLLLGT